MTSLSVANDYFQRVSAANTEEAKKLQFVNYLNQVFGQDPEARTIISEFAGGAERKILNIKKLGNDKNKTGFADTQYRKVIIEFESDIKAPAKLRHAEYQLQEYFAGNFNSHRTEDFRLLATDGTRWKVYGALPESYLNKTSITPEEVKLKETEAFTLTPDTAGQLFGFIDRHLFRLEKQVPTLDNILLDFGDTSALFIHTYGQLKALYTEVQKEPELATAYKEWQKFMSVAYGSFDGSGEVFVVHTYLSVFAKLIAYELLTQDTYIDDEEMRQILTGDIFHKLQVSNFVESDFYQWVTVPKYFKRLLPAFRRIADQIADYDFARTEADILKGVYQHLIDVGTRQALGEYYTPDWLCQQVAEHFTFERAARILDPACGSGSFLLAAVRRLTQLHPDLPVEDLCQQVAGIDIHPLSVQIAKTTLLLALGKERVRQARRPVQLRVYLSNTLLMPAKRNDVALFADDLRLIINRKSVFLPREILDYPTLFDEGVSVAEHFAHETQKQADISETVLTTSIAKRAPKAPAHLHGIFYEMYQKLKQAKEKRTDSIWQFMLHNTYKPFFLRQQFDYVLGNPPWFTYNSIANKEYQQDLLRLAKAHALEPRRKALMPQLEIAAIFLSHVSSYMLRQGGRLAFVLPRSFLSADQHDNTRTGAAKGFRLQEIWDLKDVDNLFPVPACVLFTEAWPVERAVPAEGLPGLSWKGRPRRHNATWEQAKGRVVPTPVQWHLSHTNSGNAFTAGEAQVAGAENYYRPFFSNGATMIPRNFFFVRPDSEKPNDWHDRTIPVRSDESNDKDAKAPWKEVKLKGIINTNFLFRTAQARHLVPFGLVAPPLVVLPASIELVEKGGQTVKTLHLYSPEILRDKGELETATWFGQVEKSWNKHRTEKNAKTTAINYMNWQGKLTNQDFNAPYIVMYSASAKDANAVVYERGSLDLEFVVDKAAYAYYTYSAEEAHYLAAFLNSDWANEQMKPFQSSGLFGARDVSRKILDVPLPRFDAANPLHIELATEARACATEVTRYIEAQHLHTTEYSVGKVRLYLRNTLLRPHLTAIDALLRELLGL
ncbi:Eco57I restriction-modification methylase domain-containing protein [Hymenobacter amundsenii]|nr:N-6 DNA methylase [Hymenobacter amundsenii]